MPDSPHSVGGILNRITFPTHDLKNAADAMRPLGAQVDRRFHGRIRALTRPPFVRAMAMAVIAAGIGVGVIC